MPKVLVSDKLAPQGLEILEKTPELKVDYQPGLEPQGGTLSPPNTPQIPY